MTVLVLGAQKSFSQTVLPSAGVPKAISNTTIFKCVPYGNDYLITVAQRGINEAGLFVWHRQSFEGKVSPQAGCNQVSQNLTNVVARNGGTMRNLLLTMGRVNGKTVICWVNNSQKGCNASNIVFTLNSEDAQQYSRVPSNFLENLTNFQVQKNSTSILQFVGTPINDIDRQFYFDLESWENVFLTSKKTVKMNASDLGDSGTSR